MAPRTEEIGPHLVVEAGDEVAVYLHTDAKKYGPSMAVPAAARFPATEEGRTDAVEYAKRKDPDAEPPVVISEELDDGIEYALRGHYEYARLAAVRARNAGLWRTAAQLDWLADECIRYRNEAASDEEDT